MTGKLIKRLRTARRGVILGGLLGLCPVVGAHAENTFREGNPIVYGVGLCDPDAVVYGDRLFLYASNDPLMMDWRVWSTDNLTDWKLEGTLPRNNTFLDANDKAGKRIEGCWASCGATRNGKYYWYYCSGDNLGVSVSDTPVGPWTDPLGKPLVTHKDYPTGARDPDVFTDDDGRAYLIWGVHKYFIAPLNEDMISLAAKASPIKFINAHGPGGFGTLDDKPALHKRNGKYYLSWSSFYAVSDNVYGPYRYRGTVLSPASMAQNFLPERKEDRFNERSWEKLHLDRHGDFFQYNGQWYYECNDFTQGDVGRCAIIGYAHYYDNGDIAPVQMNPVGVGQYDAFMAYTEAENYFKAHSIEVRETESRRFAVRNISTASQLHYPRVMNLCANTTMSFYFASGKGGEIEVRQGGPESKMLGVLKVEPTGGLDDYKLTACKLQNEAGTLDLCLTFKGGEGELMRLDSFGFPDSQACLLASGSRQRSEPPYQRMAMSARATSEDPERRAANVFDGELRTFWCPKDQVFPQSLTADLGQPEKISEMRIAQRRHGEGFYSSIKYIKRVAISVSEDGKNFEKLTEQEWPMDPRLRSVQFGTPRQARYVRVDILEAHENEKDKGTSGRVSISELQFVTPEPAQR